MTEPVRDTQSRRGQDSGPGGRRGVKRPHAAGASRILVAGVSAAGMLGIVAFLSLRPSIPVKVATPAPPPVAPVPGSPGVPDTSTTAPAATSASAPPTSPPSPTSTPAGAPPVPRPRPRTGPAEAPARGGTGAAPVAATAPAHTAPATPVQSAPAPVTKTKGS